MVSLNELQEKLKEWKEKHPDHPFVVLRDTGSTIWHELFTHNPNKVVATVRDLLNDKAIRAAKIYVEDPDTGEVIFVTYPDEKAYKQKIEQENRDYFESELAEESAGIVNEKQEDTRVVVNTPRGVEYWKPEVVEKALKKGSLSKRDIIGGVSEQTLLKNPAKVKREAQEIIKLRSPTKEYTPKKIAKERPKKTKKASGKVYRNEGLKSGLYTPSGFIPLSKPKSSSKLGLIGGDAGLRVARSKSHSSSSSGSKKKTSSSSGSSGLIGGDAGLRVVRSNSGRGKKSKKVFNEAEVGLIPPDVVLGRIETEIKSKPYTELEVEAYKLSKELEKEYNQLLIEKQKLEELKLKARNNPALAKQINERIAKFNEKVAKFNEKRAKLERMSKELEVRAPPEVKFIKAVSNIRKDYEKYLEMQRFGPLKGLAMGAFDTLTSFPLFVAQRIHERRAEQEIGGTPIAFEFGKMLQEQEIESIGSGIEWARSKPHESVPYIASSLVAGVGIGKVGGRVLGPAVEVGRAFKVKLTEFKPTEALLITEKGAKKINPQEPLILQVGLTKLETIKPVVMETTEKGLVKTKEMLTLVEKSAGVGKALQVSKSEKAIRGAEFKTKTTRLGYELGGIEPFEMIYKFKNPLGQRAYARVRYGEGETSVMFKSPKKSGLMKIKVEETHPVVERFDEALIKQTKPRGRGRTSFKPEEIARDFEEKAGLDIFKEQAKAKEQVKSQPERVSKGAQEVKTVERTTGRVHYFDLDIREFVRSEVVETGPKPSTFTPTIPIVASALSIPTISSIGALGLLQIPQISSEKPKTTPKPHISLENMIVPSTRTEEGTGERTKTPVVPFVGTPLDVGTISEVNTLTNVKTTQTTETAQRTTGTPPVSPPAPPVTPPLATLPPLLIPPVIPRFGGGLYNLPTVGGVKPTGRRKQSYVGLLAGFAELNAFELFTGKKGAHLLVPEIASPYWEKSLASAGFVEVPTAQEILGSKKKKKKGRGKKK